MSSTLPQLDLGNTFGALFIGVVLAAILFGVTNVQTFIYFQTHRDTGMTIYKLVVTWLWICDAFHLAVITHCIYYYLVTNYANISALTEIVWSFKLRVVGDILIILSVHVTYSYRIWILSKGRSRALPVIVWVAVILSLGVGIALSWGVYQCRVFTDLIGVPVQWLTLMTLGMIAFVDFIIASSLCYFLATSRTGFYSTDSFLTKLMTYSINTGCLTSVFSMTIIITCAVMPNNFIFLGIEFLIAKLYVNSFLALLNARYYLQASDSGVVDISTFRAHRPLSYHGESEAENVQGSQMNVYKYPHDHDHELHATRPVQAVMPQRPIAVMVEMSPFSSA